jgi:UDP-glucose 4-epimerase
MKTYAVIGGAGFIGSHFVDRLATEGNKIKVIDNFCSGTIHHISRHIGKSYFELINMNVEDTLRLIKVLNEVDTVIHLASNPDIAAAMTNPRIDFLQGTALTESVVEAIRLSGVKKILYASGSGVYGDVDFHPILETNQLLPVSPYGASKLASEALISAYAYMFNFQAIAFRFANVVGPRQTHGVGYDFIRRLNSNPNELKILGNGTQTKSYIHVDDIVQGVLHLEGYCKSFFDVFNISTDDSLTVLDIAALAFDVLKIDPINVNIIPGEENRGWKGDVPRILLNTNKIRSTGWQTTRNSKKSMEDALLSMKNEILTSE